MPVSLIESSTANRRECRVFHNSVGNIRNGGNEVFDETELFDDVGKWRKMLTDDEELANSERALWF